MAEGKSNGGVSTNAQDGVRRRTPSSGRMRAAAICAPGLEDICAAEIQALGCKPKTGGPGVIEFDANARSLYSANVWLRTASRVIVRVATFRATDFFHLQRHASEIDWSAWVPKGFAPEFRISTTDSKLYHTKAIAQRLHQVSLPPGMGEPTQLFVVRINRNTVTISADASGEGLHRRPWRSDTGSAPLRPNLAAAMVMASGWTPEVGPLVDPFCGSGTIGIEAALLAHGMPPGGQREFAFQHWPDFEPGSWASVAASVASSQRSVDEVRLLANRTGDEPLIVLSDRDSAATATAEKNATAAEIPAATIGFETQVVSHIKPRSGAGQVVTNPPYGKRLGKAEMTGLYKRLGAVVRERMPDCGLSLVTTEESLAKAADGRLRATHRFRNGGLAVQLFHYPPRSE